jgi:formate hydrogenlyase subunit 4
VALPCCQLYADLWKSWRKGVVYSPTTTILFRLGPVVLVCTALLAAGLLPLDGTTSPIRFTGDLVAFAGLLALGRFMLVLAALDTGSSFEGMGASREVTFAVFAEPALFLCFTVFVVATGDLRLQGMLGQPLAHAWLATAPSLLLGAASLFIVSLAETNRVPIDDPLTHLELTMVHEVMVLDHFRPGPGAHPLRQRSQDGAVREPGRESVRWPARWFRRRWRSGLLLIGLVVYAMAWSESSSPSWHGCA